MNTPSDRTLFVLLVVTLFTIGASIFLILAKLNMGFSLLTGYATAIGTVNVTVSQSIAIALSMNKVEFGTCTPAGAAFSINTTAAAAFLGCGPAGPLTVRNDGNSVINITINGSTAANFLGGTSPVFQYNATNNETAACPMANLSISNTPQDMAATYKNVCNSTGFANTSDEINIDVFLTVPADASFTYKLANITLTSFSL